MASSAGSVRREVLDRASRTKINTKDDYAWYSVPRLCTHVDDEFLSQLTELYRQRVPPGGKVSSAVGTPRTAPPILAETQAAATPQNASDVYDDVRFHPLSRSIFFLPR